MLRRLLPVLVLTALGAGACTAPAATTTSAPGPTTPASTPASAAPATTPGTPSGAPASPSVARTAGTLPSTVATAPATPVPGAVTAPGRVTIAQGLTNPWQVAFLPDGSALVTQRESQAILRVTVDGAAPTEVGRVAAAVKGGEGGTLGLVVSPQFATDRLVYVYYSTATDNRVATMTWSETGLVPGREILTGIPHAGNHNGGRMAFGPDGKLYITTGDASQRRLAQDTSSLGGKILRLNPDGSIPADNPFGNAVWSYGHRNVEGLAWDKSGRLVASEFGENTVDEINIIEKGKNYGWPDVEGPGGTARGYVDPVATWSPTSECSPAGIAFDAAAANLYVGCLRGTHLSRIPWQDGRPGTPTKFVTDLGRVRGVALGPGGRLWTWTSNSGGDVVVVLPA